MNDKPTAVVRHGALMLLLFACGDKASPQDSALNAGTSAPAGTGAVSGSAAMSASGSGGMTAGSGVSTAGTTAGTSAAGTGTAGTTPMTDSGLMDMDGGMSGGDGGDEPPAMAGTCLQGTGDYTDMGPYGIETTQVSIGDKGMFTIYYPDPLEADCPHPITAWGNGTTITGGTAYDHFLNHAASWGIVSIASHNSNVGDGSFHQAAIDYLLEQNMDSGSEFFGKLSTRAGVSGHSQGGAGADRSSVHPNVEAVVNVQGSFGNPPSSDAALLCLTGTDDIQPTGCPMAVEAATVPALSASWDGADHVSTTLFEGEGSDQYLRLYSAWFRCFLADDTAACAMFMGGADCPVCMEPGWDEIFANNY